MKINKLNMAHWFYLVLFGLNVICAIGFRPLRRTRSPKTVVLYGHKLSGNLLALYKQLSSTEESGLRVVFLTLDPAYHRKLRNQKIASVLAIGPQCAQVLSEADAVITDHGLHALLPMLRFSSIKFFDVWHGIPFKGFDADDFRVQHRYDEVWVASPLLAKIYVERFGFSADKVKVTGYARTDRLVRRNEDTAAIKRRLGLPATSKIVLFAPTWKQDARKRSIFPFGTSEQAFYRALSELGARTGATIVMRTHLNSGAGHGADLRWPHVVHLPHELYPDTEAILLVTDILVCDWSSIAFDFLLLDRPTIFLGVEQPFAKGFSLGPEYRFGAIACDMQELLQLLTRYLDKPGSCHEQFSVQTKSLCQAIYADYADGGSTHRCVEKLRSYLASSG